MRRAWLHSGTPAVRLWSAAILVVCAPIGVRGQEPFPGLEAYVAKAINDWHIPGLGIAIVRNDSVLYAKGFGVLSAGSRTPVNEHTLFEIGSSSKAFTGTLIAMLVSDSVLRFDDRIGDPLPAFRLADPLASAEVTIRDALTHRSGISRGELIWLGSGLTRDEILHRVRYLKPQSPFRSQFSYQNIMYLAAREVAGRVTGRSWDELIVERIFRPLGMDNSVTSHEELRNPNTARPHGIERDSVYVKPGTDLGNVGPAGSILSSPRDMAQWPRARPRCRSRRTPARTPTACTAGSRWSWRTARCN